MLQKSWTWIERLFGMTSVHYTFVSLTLGSILFLVFVLFSLVIFDFKLNFYNRIIAVSTCLLIPYQLSGVKFLLDELRGTLAHLKTDPKKDAKFRDLCDALERRFTRDKLKYVIIILVILPFILIDINYGLTNRWYEFFPNIPFELYSRTLEYVIYFLFAIILWIIINISWTLKELSSDEYISIIKLDIFSTDELGGLGILKSLVLKAVVFYFLGTALAILSYAGPSGVVCYESMYYIILLIIGVIFFFICMNSVNRVLKGCIEAEMKDLRDIYYKKRMNFMVATSEEGLEIKKEELECLSTSLDTICSDRE